MKPWLKWTLIVLTLALLAAGLLRTLSARQTSAAALAAQQQAQKIQVVMAVSPADLVEVKTLDLPATVAIVGSLKAVNTAFVKARIAGELQGLRVREGDAVQAGQVLAHIDPLESNARLSQARQQAQAARAQVDIAQRSFDNSRALAAQGFISGTALETAQATLAGAQSTHAAALAAADVAAKALDDTLLRAPIAGLIAQRLAQSGERLAVDARVLEIVDLSRLELEAALSAAEAMPVRVGQTAQLQMDGLAAAITARVVRINPNAAPGSRAVLVYLAVDPVNGLRQGLFVQGLLTTGAQKLLAVPLVAVRTDRPQPYLQTVINNQVQHLTVTPGVRSEVNGQTLVAITGAPEGTLALAGSVGILRVGTPVKINTPAAGTR